MMDDDEGPITKASRAAAQAELELQQAARDKEKEELRKQAALVGETALALARLSTSPEPNNRRGSLRGSGNLVLTPDQLIQLQRGRFSPSANVSPGGKKLSVAARARLEADLPTNNRHSSKSYNSPKPSDHQDAGVSRGKFSPQQVKQMIDAWGKDDTSEAESSEEQHSEQESSDGSNWNDEYLRPSLSADAYTSPTANKSSEKRYIKSLEKSNHHLFTSPDKDNMYQYQHHRVSNYKTHMKQSRSTDSLKSSNSSNNSVGEQRNVGIFQTARSWLNSQRDKLHRLELERQVEDQRRKLVEEGRRRRFEEAEAKRRWENRPAAREAAREMMQQQTGSTEQQNYSGSQEDLVQVPSYENTAVQTIVGFCGMGLDDGDDDETMARVNSEGQLTDVSDSDEYLKVGTPRGTVSGNGMCVKVDLPQEEARDLHRVDHYECASSPQQQIQQRRNSFHHDQVKVVDEPHTEIPPILSQSQIKSLVLSGALPASLHYCKWERLYSLTRDGDSFDTFLRNVEGRDRTVLVVKTTLDKIFGGYADTRWESKGVSHHAHEFYGTGQACLFRYTHHNNVMRYKWSGANRYIQLCDSTKRTIAFGGGGDEGVFGLCIEDDFRRGTTGHCETFQNEPLCEEGYFDVVDLEVWGFRLDF
eukprot:scaffold249325_cov73-Cyclotella_meneghiniana.AAC.4